MTASIGTYGQLAIGTTNPPTFRIQYKDEDLTAKAEIIDGNALRGTRSSSIQLERNGMIRVDGPIAFVPTAIETANLLPWILGGAPTGSPTVTYPLAELTTAHYVTIDRVIKVFTYAGCKVNMATFRAAQGGPLEVELDLVGQTETVGNAGTFPVLNLDLTNGPFIFQDCVISVASTTVNAKDISISVNNMIDKDRFFNQQTLTQVNELDRVVNFSTNLPFGDYSALYTTIVANPAAGVAVTCTFTNGGAVLEFAMGAWAVPIKSPGTPGRVEIMLPLSGRCFKSGSSGSPVLELITTLNPGP